MQKNLKSMVLLAIMAATYVVLTVALAPFSYGIIQFRVSEILNHLMAYNKKFIVSLGVGVFIANLYSSAGIYDLIFGTGATVLACIISIIAFKYIKSHVFRLIFNIFNFTLIGMLPIAMMLYFLNVGEATLLATYMTLLPSEFVVMCIGAVIFYLVDKQLHLKKLFNI